MFVITGRMDLKRLWQEMDKRNLDAVVALTQENTYYSTGAYITTQKTVPPRLGFALFPYGAQPTLLVCSIEESVCKDQSWVEDLRLYTEFTHRPVEAFADLLKEKGLQDKHIGIEMHYLPWSESAHLENMLPNARFSECKDVFYALRAVKRPDEVEVLAHAARGTTSAIMAAFEMARPGWTEKQLSGLILKNILDSGADLTFFMTMGSGERGLISHPIPNDTVLEKGTVLRLDCGGIYEGYLSDVARTVAIGEPSAHRKDMYKRILEVQRIVIEKCTVGTPISELYHLSKRVAEQKGLAYWMPHFGHSMGVECHEEPMINAYTDTLLEENMILNVEPLFWDLDDGVGYHTEDLIVVTNNGPRILTGSDLSLDIPVIK